MLWLLLATALGATDLSDVVSQRLAARDPVACAALDDLGPAGAVRDALVDVADTVERPPWVPMRAAACVMERVEGDAVALDAARRWAGDATRPGLALVVLRGLDPLPEPTALDLADRAVEALREPRVARYAAAALAASRHPSVSARAAALP